MSLLFLLAFSPCQRRSCAWAVIITHSCPATRHTVSFPFAAQPLIIINITVPSIPSFGFPEDCMT